MSLISKILISLACAVSVSIVCVVGCYPGDPIAHKVVLLELPEHGGNDDIQKALQIIDGVFVNNGFPHGEKPIEAVDQANGILAMYGRYTVFTNNRSLVVGFTEFGKRHSSPIVNKMCDQLKQKLSDGFSPQRVTQDSETNWIGVH